MSHHYLYITYSSPTFDLGWESDYYWLNDVMTACAAWNLLLPSRSQLVVSISWEAFLASLQLITKIVGPHRPAKADLVPGRRGQ
mmetsp:Transcript_18107/g.26087  ORF Transcript_18107/g.26087 Transcript_18107/m.26087 type:complete len:84 (-) Transcript_18107:1722-1973(-)